MGSPWLLRAAAQSSRELPLELVSTSRRAGLGVLRQAWLLSAVRPPGALAKPLEAPELASESRLEHRPAAKYETSQFWS